LWVRLPPSAPIMLVKKTLDNIPHNKLEQVAQDLILEGITDISATPNGTTLTWTLSYYVDVS
jgi:hypothetical protein